MTAIPHTRGPVQRFLAFLLIALLLTPLPAMAGNDDTVTVTMGEPSAWSLEQAHYLFERMHAINHGLNSKRPDQDALDPNAINGSRIEVLRTVLSAAVQFNAPLAAETEAKLDSFQLDLNRRRNLQARLDQARARHQEVVIQLTALQNEKARLHADPATRDQATLLDPQITALTGEKTALETQMTSLTTELSTAVAAPELDAPTPTIGGDSGIAPEVAESMASNLITKALEGTGTGLANPRLHVSTVLDNHIQMQYEIIAKQLSLLRDEVGPDQRVIFLELPVSIYTVPKKANKKLVQVTWTLDSVCMESKLLDKQADTIYMEMLSARKDDGSPDWDAIEAKKFYSFKNLLENSAPRERLKLQNAASRDPEEARSIILDVLQGGDYQDRQLQGRGLTYKNIVRTCEDSALWTPVQASGPASGPAPDPLCPGGPLAGSLLGILLGTPASCSTEKVQARIVDLVPRQSALNVNQIYDTSRVGAFGLQALWSGIGAAAQFQRQRELFEQFIHQDMFASGFGKGETKFGWTFGPLPGTKRIAPGVRSTFAVVVLPRDAAAIKLKSSYDIYKQRELPTMTNTADYSVPLPSVDHGFYVNRITYTPVEPGKRVTVFLSGENFSPQIGVLVNGVPLKRAISIGRPKLVSDEIAAPFAGAPHDGIDGEYELVNSQRIALQFSAGSNYEGTPSIALVTPQKANLINHYWLGINSDGRARLVDVSEKNPMFLPRLEVHDVRLTSCTGTPPMCDVDIIGKGFRPQATIRINNEDVSGLKQGEVKPEQYSTTLYRGRMKKPETAELEVVMRQPTRQKLEEVNPRLPNRLVFRTIGYEVLAFEKENQDERAFVHVRIGLLGVEPGDTVEASQIGTGKVDSVRLASGDLKVKLRNAGDSLLVELTRNSSQTEVVPIVIPAPPRIRAVVGPAGKDKGLAAGGYLVTLQGTNLQDVKRVFFGGKSAAVQRATPSELVVTAPAGEVGTVLIRLETDVRFLGRFLDNGGDPVASSSFTYEAPPPPKA